MFILGWGSIVLPHLPVFPLKIEIHIVWKPSHAFVLQLSRMLLLTRYGIFYVQRTSTGVTSSIHRLRSTLHLLRYGKHSVVTHQAFGWYFVFPGRPTSYFDLCHKFSLSLLPRTPWVHGFKYDELFLLYTHTYMQRLQTTTLSQRNIIERKDVIITELKFSVAFRTSCPLTRKMPTEIAINPGEISIF